MAKIRIIHAITDTNIGGAGVLLLSCLRHADKEKFDIAVVLPRGAALVERVRALGFNVFEIKGGADKSFDTGAIGEYKKIFNAQRPHIVHTHASFSARIAAKQCRVPKVFQTHHCAVPNGGLKSKFPFKNIFANMENRLTDRFVATADVAKTILIDRGIKEEKITTIINGSEPLRLVSEAEKAVVRQTHGLSRDNFVVGIVARLEEVKNHRCFLEAAAEAARAHSEMRFLVVGSGTLEDQLKAYAGELGIADKVIFAGFAPDTAPLMSVMDVNVNTSHSETSNLALSEGFSIGLPAVVSDCHGNCAMIENGVSGLTFENGNSESLATALETLCERRDLLASMSKAAKQRYEQKFSASVMTARLEQLYLKELKGAGQGERK